MKKTQLISILLVISSFACTTQQKESTAKQKQAYQENSPTAHHKIALEVIEASKAWIKAFNESNIKACADGYSNEATMRAKPLGLKEGKKAITKFWTSFIATGATNLVYTNTSIEVIDNNTALLSANWSMNIGRGIIFQEKWERKNDEWLLTYDDFQVLEQFKTPQQNTTNPIASHIQLEEVINASIQWINDFNAQNAKACANGYSANAMMNAISFASVSGKENIKSFWTKLITDGANNLTYNNPTFFATTSNSVKLSSNWSMNIGEGKIFQEKWIKQNDVWLLEYDEFKVMQRY